MLLLLKRTAIGLGVMTVGLILLSLGVSAGAWIAAVGFIGAALVNLLAPLPGRLGWRDYRRKRD